MPGTRPVACPEGKIASWSEKMLLRREGPGLQRHIIDRLFVDESGGLAIVDYKTGADTAESRSAWEAQLNRYAEAAGEGLGAEVREMSIYNPETGSRAGA